MGFMPIGDYTVTYTDGTTEQVTSNFKGLVEIERRWPNQDVAPGVEAIGIAVWHYLDCPNDSLDEWLKTVHLIEDTKQPKPLAAAEDPAPEVPTEPAAGAA